MTDGTGFRTVLFDEDEWWPGPVGGLVPVALLPLLVGLLSACGPAGGIVSIRTGGATHLYFDAAAGKDNIVTVSREGGDLVVADDGDVLRARGGMHERVHPRGPLLVGGVRHHGPARR